MKEPTVSHQMSPLELYNKGLEFISNERYDDGIKCWKEAARLYAEMGDTERAKACLNMLSSVYQNLGYMEEAIETHQKTYEISPHA